MEELTGAELGAKFMDAKSQSQSGSRRSSPSKRPRSGFDPSIPDNDGHDQVDSAYGELSDGCTCETEEEEERELEEDEWPLRGRKRHRTFNLDVGSRYEDYFPHQKRLKRFVS